jgi:ADP-heptose:LPS heptosyltransferase
VEYDDEVKNQARQLYDKIVTELNLQPEKTRIAALNLSAGLERREWPLEKNVRFLQQVIEKYQDKIDAWVVFTNPAKPSDAAELVRKVDDQVLITPDTSISHAASAMGTPVLVLTIGENVTIWDPIGVIHKIIFSDDPFSLEPLAVEKVVEGFDQLMQDIKS